MATATLTSKPTVIDNAEAVTNWGGDTFTLYNDSVLQGSNAVGCLLSSTGNNDVYVTGTWDFSSTTVIRLWFNITFIGNLSATNPIQLFLYDGTNTAYYYWDEFATYAGGWAQVVIDTSQTIDSGSVTLSSITRIGLRFVTATKPRNTTYNALFDAWTYGDGYVVTGGTSGDPIDWSHIAATDAVDAFNIVEERNGVYFLRGDIQIGDGTSTTYFEPDGQVAVFVDEQVSTALYGITFFDDASALTNVNISGGAWSAGTLRYYIDASATDINAFTIDGLQVSKAGVIDFHAGASITNTSFSNCYQIDPSTSTFESNTVSNYSETTVNGALLWPGGTTVKTCSFINCDEAIEITQTTNQTFDALLFSSNTDDVHLNNGGNNINVSKNNGSNPTTYVATGGGVVTFVGASVTTLVTCTDQSDNSPVEGAAVTVRAAGTGPYPYNASVTISQTGGTATVAHTAHGLSTGQKVEIRGADQNEYNRIKTITVTGVNAYTFTVPSGTTSPATGTITSTAVFIDGLTNTSGQISDTRVFATDQAVNGYAAKGTVSPLYKRSPLSGTIDDVNGLSIPVFLVLDE